MATGLEKGFLGLAVAGGVYYVFFRKEDKASAADGGLTASQCEDLLSKLPDPFRSVMLSDKTDWSNPETVEFIASELDKAGFKKEASCLRHFKHDIVKEAGSPTNCEDLIGKVTFLNDAQKGFIRAAIANNSLTQDDMLKIENALNVTGDPAAKELAKCIHVISAEKKTGSTTPDFLDQLKKVFTTPGLEVVTDPSKLGI
jgi:hypothetical protein